MVVAALREPAAASATFEVVDEWAKAPDEKAAVQEEAAEAEGAVAYPSAAADALAPEGSGGAAAAGGSQGLQDQLPGLFRGLVADVAATPAVGALQQQLRGGGTDVAETDVAAQQLYGMKVA